MILILDANNMAYRALYSVQLSFRGVDTSITYGSLLMTTALLRKFQPSSIIACFDGGSPPFRKELFPEYKAHRTHNSDERDWEDVYRQIDELCYYAFPIHGIMTLRKKDIEADDLMAQAAYLSEEKCCIVTTDDDLLQCVDEQTIIYNPTKDEMYTEDNILSLTGVPQYFHLLYKMLCGDSSDNITGVPSIGPKTARKMIEYLCTVLADEDPYDYGFLTSILNDLPLNSRQKESLADLVGQEKWNALYEVMDLLFDRVGARRVVLQTEWMPSDPEKIRRYYLSHGFVSLLEERTDRIYSSLQKPQFRENERTPIVLRQDFEQ